MSILKEISKNIINLPRYTKRIIVIVNDFIICFFSTWLTFFVSFNELSLFHELFFYSALISIVIAIPIFWILGFFITPFWVRRGPEMIVSHKAPSSVNMSSYRAIWTHFRQILMIFIDSNLQTVKSCWHLR